MPEMNMEKYARSQGFPSYAAMQGFYRHRTHPQQMQGQVQPGAPPKNWLQGLIDQIPIHPSYLLNSANQKFKKAIGK